jgi:hypothetical protein
LAAETIKEFLISLGYKIDEASHRRFLSAIQGAIEPVAKLTATATGAVTAIEAMVARTAKGMNDLYYQAQRTGVVAQSLENLSFAAEQVGLKAKDGAGLMEAFTNSMQVNPGTVGLLRNLGGEFQEVNGRLSLTDKGLENVIHRLHDMPRFEALQYGKMLGLDEASINQILNNADEFIAKIHQSADTAKALGSAEAEAAEKGRAFSNEWSRFGNIISDVWTNVFNKIEPASEHILHILDDNLLEFGKWSHELGDVPAVVATVVASIQGTLTGVMGGIGLITGGISGMFEGIGASFTATFGIVSRFLGLITRVASNPVFAFFSTLLYSTGTQAGIGGGTHETEAGKEKQEQGEPAPEHPGWGTLSTTDIWNKVRGWMGMKPTTPTPGETDMSKLTPGGVQPTAMTPAELQTVARKAGQLYGAAVDPNKAAASFQQGVEYFVKQGYSKAQSMGIMSNMLVESGLDPTMRQKGGGPGFGLMQWSPARQAEFAQQYGHKMGTTGDREKDYMEQLQFSQYELSHHAEYGAQQLHQAATEAEAARIFSLRDEQPKGGQIQAEKRAELARDIVQTNTTNIEVNGTANANETARQVQDAQNGVNANNARMLSGSVQ